MQPGGQHVAVSTSHGPPQRDDLQCSVTGCLLVNQDELHVIVPREAGGMLVPQRLHGIVECRMHSVHLLLGGLLPRPQLDGGDGLPDDESAGGWTTV